MHPAAEKFSALTPDERRVVHLHLCTHSLKVWERYARFRPWLCYLDSVVLRPHRVDRRLPADALECARMGKDERRVEERYREPIAALQDDDLRLPERVEFAYYSVYNAFRKYALKQEIDDWLIVNQALSTHRKLDESASKLEEAHAAAGAAAARNGSRNASRAATSRRPGRTGSGNRSG